MERNGGRWWGAFLFELISKLLQHLGLVDTNASYLLPSSSFILFHPSTSVITGASQFQTACTVRIKSYDRNEHFLPSVGRGASRVRASQVNRASGDRSRSMDTRITNYAKGADSSSRGFTYIPEYVLLRLGRINEDLESARYIMRTRWLS
jgi:hypothetical protein